MAKQRSSERLQVVLKLASLKQQEAAKQLAEATRAQQEQRQQAEQLQSYQEEYRQQFLANTAVQSSYSLRNGQRFFDKLDEAVATQFRRSDLSEENLDHYRQEWQRAHGREQNMSKLIDSKAQQEEKHAEAQLQKALDDLSQRKKHHFSE